MICFTYRAHQACGRCAPAFHSRYDVLRKTYRYRILMTQSALRFCGDLCSTIPILLIVKDGAGGGMLKGEHDFTSFAAIDAQEDDESQIQRAHDLSVALTLAPSSSMLIYEVTGKGFLRYMVRNIVGTLIEVGRA